MPETTQINTKAIVSLVLGILSVLIVPLIGWILGIIGLIYANNGIREIEHTGERGRDLAVAGRVCSIVGIVLGVVVNLIMILGLVFMFTVRVAY